MLNCSWGKKKYKLYIITGLNDPPNNLSKTNCSVASQLSNIWNLLRGHVQMTFSYTNQNVTGKIWAYISIYLRWHLVPGKCLVMQHVPSGGVSFLQIFKNFTENWLEIHWTIQATCCLCNFSRQYLRKPNFDWSKWSWPHF